MTAGPRRFAGLLALALSACAFPFWVDPSARSDGGTDPSCELCAGACQAGSCVGSALGGRCRTDGFGAACVAAAHCEAGSCVTDCAGPTCACSSLHCAGTCAGGGCVGAPLGGGCDPSGSGPACAEGSCVAGQCRRPGIRLPPVPLADYLGVARTSYCGYLVRCDRWPASLAGRCGAAIYPDAPDFDSDARQAAEAAAGSLTYDPAAAGDCLHGFETLGCRLAYPDACDQMFGGAAAEGARCTATADCAPALWCRRNDLSGLRCEGLCAARGVAGDDCAEVPCGAGLTCTNEGDPGTTVERCRARSAAGTLHQPCGNARPACLGDLACSATSATCERRQGENEACDNPFGCADGLVCGLIDGNTRAICLPRRARGESCRAHQQCSPLTLRLDTDACLGGVCTPLPADGACVVDSFLANGCDPVRASCGQDQRCHPWAREGEACVTPDDCGGLLGTLVCSFGACRAPLACTD